MKREKYKDILRIIFGTLLVGFLISNIHSRYKLAEGSQLGVEFLFYNWFYI